MVLDFYPFLKKWFKRVTLNLIQQILLFNTVYIHIFNEFLANMSNNLNNFIK